MQGRTDAIAADKAGFSSAETYRQAKTVVQNASPEWAALKIRRSLTTVAVAASAA